MGKKKGHKNGQRGDAPTRKPKGLRKQLHKAEADLAKAVAKRDKAQARVEAMSIIADEIRARLAEHEKATAKTARSEAASNTSAKPAPKKTSGARKRTASGATSKGASATRKAAGTAKTAPAAPKKTTGTGRTTAGSSRPQPPAKS
jgi:hypothetical protein